MKLQLIKIFVVLGYICRFLVGNIYGFLILLLSLYFLLPIFTNITPLSYDELLLFIMALESQYKVAILTSVITIIGFFSGVVSAHFTNNV